MKLKHFYYYAFLRRFLSRKIRLHMIVLAYFKVPLSGKEIYSIRKKWFNDFEQLSCEECWAETSITSVSLKTVENFGPK